MIKLTKSERRTFKRASNRLDAMLDRDAEGVFTIAVARELFATAGDADEDFEQFLVFMAYSWGVWAGSAISKHWPSSHAELKSQLKKARNEARAWRDGAERLRRQHGRNG